MKIKARRCCLCDFYAVESVVCLQWKSNNPTLNARTVEPKWAKNRREGSSQTGAGQ